MISKIVTLTEFLNYLLQHLRGRIFRIKISYRTIHMLLFYRMPVRVGTWLKAWLSWTYFWLLSQSFLCYTIDSGLPGYEVSVLSSWNFMYLHIIVVLRWLRRCVMSKCHSSYSNYLNRFSVLTTTISKHRKSIYHSSHGCRQVSYKCMSADTMPYPRHDSRLGITVVVSFL